MPNPMVSFLSLAAIALAIFAYGLYRRRRLWAALGKPELRFDNLKDRLKLLLVNGLLQLRPSAIFIRGSCMA